MRRWLANEIEASVVPKIERLEAKVWLWSVGFLIADLLFVLSFIIELLLFLLGRSSGYGTGELLRSFVFVIGTSLLLVFVIGTLLRAPGAVRRFWHKCRPPYECDPIWVRDDRGPSIYAFSSADGLSVLYSLLPLAFLPLLAYSIKIVKNLNCRIMEVVLTFRWMAGIWGIIPFVNSVVSVDIPKLLDFGLSKIYTTSMLLIGAFLLIIAFSNVNYWLQKQLRKRFLTERGNRSERNNSLSNCWRVLPVLVRKTVRHRSVSARRFGVGVALLCVSAFVFFYLYYHAATALPSSWQEATYGVDNHYCRR